MKKPKHPAFAFLWLLMIPVQLIIYAALIALGAYADISMSKPSAYGHPAPFVSVLATLGGGVLTVIVVVITIILVIVRYSILNKRYKKWRQIADGEGEG